MSMKLMILGLLMEKDSHPYEIRQVIRSRNWDYAFKLRDGSLYYAIDQMREHGLIEAIEVVPVPGDNRPDKTIYRITEAGRQIFLKLMYAQLEQEAYPQHPMMMAMPFLRHGDQRRIAAIASEQLAACEARIEKLEAKLRERGELMPLSSSRNLEGMLLYARAEAEWLRTVTEEAQAGLYDQRLGADGRWRASSRDDDADGNPQP